MDVFPWKPRVVFQFLEPFSVYNSSQEAKYAEVQEVAFNSEGKHKMPKQDPDTAVRGEGAGMKACSVLDTEGYSLHTATAAM